MQEIAFSGGPLDGTRRRFLLQPPQRVPLTAREGGGHSDVDCYYELDDGILVWRGPDR